VRGRLGKGKAALLARLVGGPGAALMTAKIFNDRRAVSLKTLSAADFYP